MSIERPDYSYIQPHVSVYEKLAEMPYSEARRWLKSLWMTRGEQSEIIRRAKNHKDSEEKG